MFDALSFAEIDGQHAELLPARTVLSLFSATGGGDGGVHCQQIGLVNVQNVAANLPILNIIPIASPSSASVSC